MQGEFELAEIKRVTPIGEGARVCIDFIDQLSPTEGVLVGNTGHGYFFVLAENRQTDTYPKRPFRVNAGAIHHYIVTDEDKTNYLQEIQPGNRIPVFCEDGTYRKIPVGRVKIEKRPFVRVEAKVNDHTISVTMQEADSVHILGEKMEEKQVIQLEEGDKVYVRLDQAGRHLGEKIQEEIVEK
jgi:3-dehydroquinate synthase II